MATSVKPELHATAQELALQLKIGLPISLASLSRRALDVLTIAAIGRLGPADMAAASLATSTTSILALSVFVGLSSATVTLTSQARGAGDKSQAGLWLHRTLLINVAVAVPLAVLLLLLSPLLRLMGQDEALSSAAGTYCSLLLPGMFAMSATWAINPWLQCHGIVRPQLVVAGVMVGVHVLLLWLLVRSDGLGYIGAALAASSSQILNICAIAGWVLCRLRRHVPLVRPSRASLARWPAFFRLGCPGVLMLGEWWASEIGILLTGLLPEPATNLAAMSVYQAMNALSFMWPYGASNAGATRVGATLGAGMADSACRAAKVAVGVCVSFGVLSSLVLLLTRSKVAALFTSDAAVAAKVTQHGLRTHTDIQTYTHTHAHIHTYTHTDMHTCTHTHMHTYTHTHIHTYTACALARMPARHAQSTRACDLVLEPVLMPHVSCTRDPFEIRALPLEPALRRKA